MSQSTSRRTFLKTSAATAAALTVPATLTMNASSYANIIGANDDIRIAVAGFNSRGKNHIDAWRKIKGVRLVALCDVDEAVLDKGVKMVSMPLSAPTSRPTTGPSTRATVAMSGGPSTRPTTDSSARGDKKSTKKKSDSAMAKAATRESNPSEFKGLKVARFVDVRKLLDSKEIDAISTASPNHWHALMSIWACQAGKDVYVEKPVSHEVWEGRKIVEAARKYDRIVQAGTQSRSNAALREAFAWLHEGGLGKVQISRGLCYKRRGAVPAAEGGHTKIPSTVDYDLWLGPAAKEELHREKFHYDWHWFWNTGCGDLGNQGIHQMDIARWRWARITCLRRS